MKIENKLLRNIICIILPITLQNLIGAAVNTADVVMLGNVSQVALSASSLANQIVSILFMFFTSSYILSTVLIPRRSSPAFKTCAVLEARVILEFRSAKSVSFAICF